MGIALIRGAAIIAVIASAFAYAVTRPAEPARACGAAGPFDFDTYEAENYIADYGKAIDLAVAGQMVNFSYNIGTESVDLRYQGLVSGPRSARLPVSTAHRVPPSLYKSIAWIEANWSNGASTVPFGGVGPVLRSFDCGYGLGQVTTGMSNPTGTATARQALIGTHYVFNIAEGVRILADKWNSAPRFRPIAGQGDPEAIEDWYYAVWSYNGFAFSNHPLNPVLDPLRAGNAISPIYHCFDDKAESYVVSNGAITYLYGDYTYPEKVYGCMRNPAKKNGAQMWAPQVFHMPDFAREPVAAAFQPRAFLDCQEAGFSGGCAAMDFPTAFKDDPDTKDVNEERNVHKDLTLPASVNEASKFLGEPRFSYAGSTQMTLTAFRDGTATSDMVTVANIGKGIGPFRIRTSAPWLVVRHAGDPATRTLDGGVAVGKEIEVVLQSANAVRPRIAQPGYESKLMITLDPSVMPTGNLQGTVWIEPLLGSGGNFEIKVTATGGANGYQYRLVAPHVANGN